MYMTVFIHVWPGILSFRQTQSIGLSTWKASRDSFGFGSGRFLRYSGSGFKKAVFGD